MRRITKIRRSIRAISPVISVLLMIAIAVVASLVAYAWVMGYMGFQTGKIGKAVQIQSSAFNTEGTQLTVYVQNVGQGTEQLNFPSNTVYVNDVPYDILVVYPSGMLAGDKITVPEGQTVGLTIDYLYVAGQELRIKIVTSDGTIAQKTTTGTEGPSPTSSAPPGNVAPSAGFTFSATNLVVQFTDASTDSDGTIASRLWAFGDTQTSTETNPSHTYAAGGTYIVRLTVTDNDGATNYVDHPVTVAAGNAAPTAAFTFDPANPTTATTITFTDGSSDSDGTIASRAWAFGDGQTSTDTNPTHKYTAADTYTVRLTVTDDDGATNYIEHPVLVTAAPTPQTITLRPTSAGSSTTLANNDYSYPFMGNWECVDETTSDDASTYVVPNTYGGYQSDTWVYDSYNINDQTLTGTINSVTVHINVRREGSSTSSMVSAYTVLRLGTSVATGTQHDSLATAWTPFEDSYGTTKPAALGGGAWTWADINNLQIGVGLRSHNSGGYSWTSAECTQVWVEINYTP